MNTKHIINNCISGKCSRCASCCTDFLPLTFKEVQELKEYIKEHNIELTDWKEFNPITNTYTFKMFCPLLEKDTNLCKAYEARPKICRTFKCCKNPAIIYKERDSIAKSAKYNKLDSHSGHLTNTYSLHELLTGNKEKTIELILGILKENNRLTLDNTKAILKMFNREDISLDDILALSNRNKEE